MAPRSEEAGSALAFSLVGVVIIASLGAGLLQLQVSIDRRMDFAVDRRRALYMAEAGIAEAALAVSSGRSGNIGSEAVPASFANGVFWVESDDLPDDRILLRCTAQVGRAELALQSMILPSVNPVTSLGLFGIDGVAIGWGTTIDGYHSGRGDYASQLDASATVVTTGKDALIGSDANIVLEEARDATALTPTHIFGRIRPGSDNHIVSTGLPEVRGFVDAYDAPPSLPQVSLPSLEEQIKGEYIVVDSQVGLGATMATEVMGPIEVEMDATLTIEGPKLLRCSSLILDAGATLVLDDSRGPIHIYAEDGLDFGAGSTVESIAPEAEARGNYLMIPRSGTRTTRVILGCSGTFHGALYAPDDDVVIPEDLRWIGSVVARHVAAEPGAHITVDERLFLGSHGFPSLPRQLSWQIVALGDEVARWLPMEPRLALTMRGVTPTPSSKAAIETNLEIQYMDLHEQPATYRGAFSAFDHSQASSIVGARWEDPRDLSTRSWATPSGSESTHAVETLRSDLRELRAFILASSPGIDVAGLTDDESIDEAAALVIGGAAGPQPAAVQRAFLRVDETPPPVAAPPLGRAAIAANTARQYADDAQALLDSALSYDPATHSEDAEKALKKVVKETEKVHSKADDAEKEADKAATETGKRQDKAVETAEKRAKDAKKCFDKVQKEYDKFIAAL